MKHFRYVLYSLSIFAVLASAFIFGRLSAPAEYVDSKTFYATVSKVDGDFFEVSGLDINDVNHRGHYHFTLDEATSLEWNGNRDMLPSAFAEGDLVAVTYLERGTLGGLDTVLKLELLDDNVYR